MRNSSKTNIFMFVFQLLPKHTAAILAHQLHRKKAKAGKKAPVELIKPGFESFRKTREDLTT